MRAIPLAIFLLSIFYCHAAQDSLVTRGPYLQLGTDTSMIVRWRTADTILCSIKYGTSVGQQSQTINEAQATTEHEIRIGGLSPFTKYFYTIYEGANVIAGNELGYSFTTNPIKGTVQPIHIWVTGDMGDSSQAQRDVRDRYWNHVRNGRHTDAWVWLGDNVYSSGTDKEYQDKLFAVYPEILRSIVSRPCPGNHDYGSIDVNQNGPYYSNFTMPTNAEAGGIPSGKEGYYSYDYGNIHFVSLNSESLQWFLTSTSEMCTWLKSDLAATQQPWKIIYWHQPAYTKGGHDSDDLFSRMYFMRTNIVPILEQYGADLVLNGHSHSYERSYPLHGHHGNSGSFDFTMQVHSTSGKPADGGAYVKYTTGPNANKGVVYTVCGNGGRIETDAPLNHPAMYFSQQGKAGFMTIDVNGMQLDAKYYDSEGTVWDEFTIVKTAENPNGLKSINDEISELNIYPNPFSDILTIDLNLASQQQLKIELLDINGKVVNVLANKVLAAGVNTLSLTTTDLSKGNYIIRVTSPVLGETSRLVTLQR